MKNAENRCLNCEFQLNDELYCPICGQKTSVHNLSLKYLFSSFSAAFLDFDRKLLSSLKDIWLPNKVSNSFLKGSRRVYVNHLRFFFICLALFFGLIALNMRQLDMNDGDLAKQSAVEQVYNEFTTYEDSNPLSCDTSEWLALKKHLFSEYQLDSDSIDNAIDIQSGLLSVNLNSKDDGFRFTDIHNLSQDSILSKYEVEGDFKKFMAKKLIKVFKSGSSVVSFTVGNMFWGIILITILMALILKLFYYRYHSFYAEHLMQMINYHCVFCLLFSVLLFIDLFTTVSTILYFVCFIASGIHLSISLKEYYNQGWFKTIIKGLFLLFSYIL